MTWFKNFSLFAGVIVTTALLSGCDVGKQDPATPNPVTTTISNTGTYSGGFTSPVKLLCIDAPGLDPQGHGECGQRYTLEGYVSLTVVGDTITAGNVSVYGYDRNVSASSKIDANGNFTYSFEHVNGKGNVKNGVMTGTVWEGPFEWKYGEFTFTKK